MKKYLQIFALFLSITIGGHAGIAPVLMNSYTTNLQVGADAHVTSLIPTTSTNISGPALNQVTNIANGVGANSTNFTLGVGLSLTNYANLQDTVVSNGVIALIPSTSNLASTNYVNAQVSTVSNSVMSSISSTNLTTLLIVTNLVTGSTNGFSSIVYTNPGTILYTNILPSLTNGLATINYVNAQVQGSTNGYPWGVLYDPINSAKNATNNFTSLVYTNPGTILYTNALPGLTNGFVTSAITNGFSSIVFSNPATYITQVQGSGMSNSLLNSISTTNTATLILTTNLIGTATNGLATINYVNSISGIVSNGVVSFVTNNYIMATSTTNLVKSATNNFTSLVYTNAYSVLYTNILPGLTNGFVTQSVTNGLASTNYVNSISGIVSNGVVSFVTNSYITASATTNLVKSATNNFTSLVYTNPSSVLYTNALPGLTNGFVTQSVTNGLASINYVTNQGYLTNGRPYVAFGTIFATNHIGIGIATPTYSLDVNGLIGNSTFGGAYINLGDALNDSSGRGGIVNSSAGSGLFVGSDNSCYLFANGRNSQAQLTGNGTIFFLSGQTGFFCGNHGFGDDLNAYMESGNDLILSPGSGNVGINNSTPMYTLDVGGEINASSINLGGQTLGTTFLNTYGSSVPNGMDFSSVDGRPCIDYYLGAGTYSEDFPYLRIQTDYDNNLYFNGIARSTGASPRSFKFWAGGQSTDLTLGCQNGPVIFYPANEEVMRVTSTGLGIGTPIPAYELDVNGLIGNSHSGNPNSLTLDDGGGGITLGGTTHYLYMDTLGAGMGIDTIDVSHILDVNGTANFSGAATSTSTTTNSPAANELVTKWYTQTLTNNFTSLVYTNAYSVLYTNALPGLTNRFVTASITNGLASTNYVNTSLTTVSNGVVALIPFGAVTNKQVNPTFTNLTVYLDTTGTRVLNVNTNGLVRTNSGTGNSSQWLTTSIFFANSNNVVTSVFSNTPTGTYITSVSPTATNTINLQTNTTYVNSAIISSSPSTGAPALNELVTAAYVLANVPQNLSLYFSGVTNTQVLTTNIAPLWTMTDAPQLLASTNTISNANIPVGGYFINRIETNMVTQLANSPIELYTYISISGNSGSSVTARPEMWLYFTNGTFVKLGSAANIVYTQPLFPGPLPITISIPITNTAYVNTTFTNNGAQLMLRWYSSAQTGSGGNAPKWTFYVGNGYASRITAGATVVLPSDIALTDGNQTFSGTNVFIGPVSIGSQTIINSTGNGTFGGLPITNGIPYPPITVINTSTGIVTYVLSYPTTLIKTNSTYNLLLVKNGITNTVIGDNVWIDVQQFGTNYYTKY